MIPKPSSCEGARFEAPYRAIASMMPGIWKGDVLGLATLDGALRHCGVNSVELLWTADGWKITQLSDTRRTEGCDEAGWVGRPGR